MLVLPPIPSWLLKTPVTIENILGQTGTGDKVTSSTDYLARLEFKTVIKKNVTGNEILGKGVIFIQGDADANLNSNLIIDSTTYQVTDVSKHNNPNGTIHHVEIVFV